jgi:hypothetical protein
VAAVGFARGRGHLRGAGDAGGFETLRHDVTLQKGRIVDAGVFRLAEAAALVVHVTDRASGAVVPEASVRLTLEGAEEGGMSAFDAVLYGESEESHSAVTDANGEARLTLFPGQRARLEIEEEAHTFFVQPDLVLPATGSMDLDVVLGVGGRVAVTVLDAYGGPSPGVRVQERMQEAESVGPRRQSMRWFGRDPRGVADQNGVAIFEHLAPGLHEFRLADAEGGGGMAAILARSTEGREQSGWVPLDVTEGGFEKLVLEEKPTATLTGLVRVEGSALVGARLQLILRREGESGGAASFRFPGMGSAGAGQTDGRGAFVIEGVEPGSYTLSVQHSTRSMAFLQDVMLVAGKNQLELDLPAATIEGRVTGPDGTPLAGVKVDVSPGDGSSGSSSFWFRSQPEPSTAVDGTVADSSVTDAEGHYVLHGVRPGILLVVSASLHGSTPVRSSAFEVADGELRRGVDLVLTPAGALRVRVSGLGEGPFAIVVATFLGDEELEPVTELLRGGETTFGALHPGKWEISITRMGAGAPEGSVASQNVEIRSGATEELSFDL